MIFHKSSALALLFVAVVAITPVIAGFSEWQCCPFETDTIVETGCDATHSIPSTCNVVVNGSKDGSTVAACCPNNVIDSWDKGQAKDCKHGDNPSKSNDSGSTDIEDLDVVSTESAEAAEDSSSVVVGSSAMMAAAAAVTMLGLYFD